MVPETLDGWTLSIVHRLAGPGVFEDDRFDFKQQMPRDDKGRLRLRKDATSFANSEGGFLVFGVHDDRSLSADLRLVGIPKLDDFLLLFGNAIHGCEPSFTCEIKAPAIELNSTHFIHVVYIPKSPRRPHGILADERWAFCKRGPGKTEPMTYVELQAAFTDRRSKLAKLRFFRAEIERIQREAQQINIVAQEVQRHGWHRPMPAYELAAAVTLLPDVFDFLERDETAIQNIQALREWIAESHSKYARTWPNSYQLATELGECARNILNEAAHLVPKLRGIEESSAR
jgi:hypothetical protein